MFLTLLVLVALARLGLSIEPTIADGPADILPSKRRIVGKGLPSDGLRSLNSSGHQPSFAPTSIEAQASSSEFGQALIQIVDRVLPDIPTDQPTLSPTESQAPTSVFDKTLVAILKHLQTEGPTEQPTPSPAEIPTTESELSQVDDCDGPCLSAGTIVGITIAAVVVAAVIVILVSLKRINARSS